MANYVIGRDDKPIMSGNEKIGFTPVSNPQADTYSPDYQSNREREREQAAAATREIAQLEAVTSGDYSGITNPNDSGSERAQDIRAAQRTSALLNTDPADFKGNYQERQEQIRAQARLKARVEKYGYGQESTSVNTSTTNETAATLVDKTDWMNTGNAPGVGDLTSIGIDETLATAISGSLGSNVETRDWVQIANVATDAITGKLDVNKYKAAIGAATSQMYGGTTVSYQAGGYQKDEAGNTLLDSSGNPLALASNLYVIGGNGTVLTSLGTNANSMSNILQSFGVKDVSWIDSVTQSMGDAVGPYSQAFETLKTSYNPFNNYLDLYDAEDLITGVTVGINPFEIITGKTISQTGTGTETTQIGTTSTATTEEKQLDTATPQTGTFTQAPNTASYALPTGYTGSGFVPAFNQTTGSTQMPTVPMTGTFTKPTTGIIGTPQPSTYTVGSTAQQQQQTAQSQPTDVRVYRNAAGMTVSITFINGVPQTPIPSGFFPVSQQAPQMPVVTQPTAPTVQSVQPYTPQFNMAQGGIVPELPRPSGKKFGGFKPEAQERIAQSLGYTGEMEKFDQFLEENPEKKQQMDKYTESAKQMAEGGYVQKFSNGGQPQSTTVSLQQYDPRVLNQQFIPQATTTSLGGVADVPKTFVGRAVQPALPTGSTIVPVGTQLDQGQVVSPYSGQISGSLALPTAMGETSQAYMPQFTGANLMSPVEATGAVQNAAEQRQAAQLDQVSQINAAQNIGTSINTARAAQGTGILMPDPRKREIETGEIISGVANAQTAAAFTEVAETQAATANPTKQATVAGQLEGLMAQFEGGNTPAWAAGSMRAATATMAARGLGASSMAGQAIIQAAMEAALPIAQMDAQVTAQFEQQNLSNRQQRAILAAQQRAQFLGQEFDQGFQARVANSAKIADIANMNFSAEQQVALENSRIANTMELNNLSNRQAMIMAEASALANMDMSNLNNRQQAAVQNAQNFLQADLTNLSNAQQMELFKSQQITQSLFTDQAAINAAQQFNASSQNQVDQFFSSLQSNAAQFNATQANAQAQFNAGQANVVERFNAEINNQRDQFNAQNQLIIDQSNAQWRREIATADTSAVNRANELNAIQTLDISNTAYNNLWQLYNDQMTFAFKASENEAQRLNNIAVQQLINEGAEERADAQRDFDSSAGFGSAIVKVLTSDLSDSILGGWLS